MSPIGAGSLTVQTQSNEHGTEPAITPELVAQHGLKPDEYRRILGLIGRTPTFTELGIFSDGASCPGH